jgi:SAM-dependent methyltransferase
MKKMDKESEPRQKGIPLLFAAVIFTSAFLLFLIQPLIAKYLLPWFGGTQAVWTTCLLFFQVFLLLGYTYAHLLTKWLQLRWQVAVHVVLLLSALFLLPITPSENAKHILRGDPTLQIIALLTTTVGFPYFLLSATGPLLQKWYSNVNTGYSPYRLYALSNVGSLLALVLYPVLIEPSLSRHWQALGWSWGVGVFAVACALCAVIVWRQMRNRVNTETPAIQSRQQLPDRRRRMLWIALPATASVLLLAITNKLCQEITVVPFLWVLPLTIYLISFIICFDKPHWYSRLWFGIVFILVYVGVIVSLLMSNDYSTLISLAIFPVFLFVSCMVCHGELVRLKPSTEYLTSYYLSIAAGGALGGLFVAIIAPLIFTDYTEFPVGFLLCAILLLVLYFTDKQSILYAGKPRWAWAFLFVLLLASGYGLYEVPRRSGQNIIKSVRNFYGTLKVIESSSDDSNYDCRKLKHGDILHGAQFTQYPQVPTTYYTLNSGLGRCLHSFPKKEGRRIGAVGLGVGTVAAWVGRTDYIRFYEINPAVKQLAEEYFTYLAECPGKVEVTLGDARLSLENEEPQKFDVLILDAFNSDTPPVHLLTEEAFELYKRHLQPGGVLALHISCRYIEFSWLVTALAEHAGFSCRYVVDNGDDSGVLRMPSDWVLATKDVALLNNENIVQASVIPRSDYSSSRLWTDDYTTLLPFLTWTW